MIVFLHSGAHHHLATLADPALRTYGITPVYLRDESAFELIDQADVVIVGDRLRRDQLDPVLDRVLAAPERGATLIVLGISDAENWLPGVTGEERDTNFWWWRTGEDCGLRSRLAGDPLAEYLIPRAVVWHYHGVLVPPAGARSIVDLEENGEVVGSVLYVDEVSTPGRIVAMTMDPAYHHGSGFMPGSTQLLYGLMRWATSTRRTA